MFRGNPDVCAELQRDIPKRSRRIFWIISPRNVSASAERARKARSRRRTTTLNWRARRSSVTPSRMTQRTGGSDRHVRPSFECGFAGDAFTLTRFYEAI
jgi:hypothetical protein